MLLPKPVRPTVLESGLQKGVDVAPVAFEELVLAAACVNHNSQVEC